MDDLAKEIKYWENEAIKNKNEKIELFKQLAVNEARNSLLRDFTTSLKQLRGDV